VDGIKGVGRTTISCYTKHGAVVELITFPDGSWGVRKNGVTVGLWEPGEQEEGFRVFAMLTDFGDYRKPGDGPSVVLLLRNKRAISLN
jgi:hypothetical protein